MIASRKCLIIIALLLAGMPDFFHLSAQVPDPNNDGWESEAFNDTVNARLNAFAAIVITAKTPGNAADIISEKATSNALRPHLTTAFNANGLTVQRGGAKSATQPFATALTSMLNPFKGGRPERVKFKVHNVMVAPQACEAYIEVSGAAADGGRIEQHANWKINWEKPGTGSELRIKSVAAAGFEEVTSAAPTIFTDATAAVLGGDDAFNGQYLFGNSHWRARIDAFNRFFKFGHNGIAVADVNGDGLDDVYSCQTGGLPNRLFLQQADGSARDGAASAGVDFLDSTRGALFADFDNDGDQDLALGLNGALMILQNDGGGKFAPRVRFPTVMNAFSLAAADYDQDGLLDLYVCRYYAEQEDGADLAAPVPYFDANNGGANFLLHNEGLDKASGWLTFSDATATAGLDVNNRRFSFAAVWDDFDNDGDSDLYVANDFGKNNLYLNTRGKFSDATAKTGLEDSAFGMSAATADINRDGITDLYVGNMFSSAGNRVTQQAQFRGGRDATFRPVFQRLARGNSMFRARLDGGQLAYEDVSVEAGVTLGRWSWGSIFMDVNNDGWEDVFVANGFVTGREPDDL
ncbi:MAG: VCBS repeat-containing protein [Verrucomicrobiae bacterium]|nr:VCBS repeat-containing protein [Verrucomicrobiae bacterium]